MATRIVWGKRTDWMMTLDDAGQSGIISRKGNRCNKILMMAPGGIKTAPKAIEKTSAATKKIALVKNGRFRNITNEKKPGGKRILPQVN